MTTMNLVIRTVIVIWAALVPKSARASVCVDGAIDYVVQLGDTPTTVKDYQDVLAKLRNDLKDPKTQYQGLPVLPKPTTPPRFIYVDLNVAQGTTITLGISKNDIVIEGYCDILNGNKRARFFKQTGSEARKQLFPKVASTDTAYINDYAAIMKAAGVSKSKAGLGVQNLRSLLADVFNKPINAQAEAKFLLVAKQMVTEAVRFKYIEDQVVEYFDLPKFVPDCGLISLEKNWIQLSNRIAKANPTTGAMTYIELENPDGQKWDINNANQIKPYIGILNYPAPKALEAALELVSLCSSLFVNRAGDDDHTEL